MAANRADKHAPIRRFRQVGAFPVSAHGVETSRRPGNRPRSSNFPSSRRICPIDWARKLDNQTRKAFVRWRRHERDGGYPELDADFTLRRHQPNRIGDAQRWHRGDNDDRNRHARAALQAIS